MSGAGGDETSLLRVAHLAPELPTPASSFVDFDISGVGSFNSFEYRRVSAYAEVSPGLRVIAVTRAGTSTELLARITPRLELGGLYTVIAYRDERESSAMNLMLIEERVDGLGVESGRLVVGHAADDSSWPAMDVVEQETSSVLVADLPFGESSDSVDLNESGQSLRFEASSPPPIVVAGPFRILVEAEEPSIVFVADEDTAEGSVRAAVYWIGPNSTGLIEALEPE